MRTFKLPGYDTFNDILPHQRQDENKPWKPKPKKPVKNRKKKADDLDDAIEDAGPEDVPPPLIPDNEVGMGGPEGRVYWPPGMEDWLKPPKRVVVKKKEEGAATPATKKRKTASAASVEGPAKKAALGSIKKVQKKPAPTPSASSDEEALSSPPLSDTDETPVGKKAAPARKKSARAGATRVSYKEEDADEGLI
jgi:UV DNA damage endonuclease